jgi:hypothetical protein
VVRRTTTSADTARPYPRCAPLVSATTCQSRLSIRKRGSPTSFCTRAHVRRRRVRISLEPCRLPMPRRHSSDSHYPIGGDPSSRGDLELASMLPTAEFLTDRRRRRSGSHSHRSRQYESVRACSKAARPGPGGECAGRVGTCLDGAGGSTASRFVPSRALAWGARAWHARRGHGGDVKSRKRMVVSRSACMRLVGVPARNVT